MSTHFLTYLFEASICLLFFYLIYWFFFKQETYFRLNRTYLISTIVLSLLIPVIKVKDFAATNGSPGSLSINGEVVFTAIQSSRHYVQNKIESNVDLLSIVFVIYLIGVVILLTKFFYQIYRLIFFIRKGEISINNRHYMICTNGQYPTSSFFKYILWDNTISYSEKEFDQIIVHEMTHLDHLHTLDNLLMEFLGIMFWFNPIIYLLNRSIKEVHEYTADNEVLNNSEFTKEDYQILINKQILNNIGFQLSNNFNMSNLKNRIAMLTKPKSGKSATLKFIVLFPLAIFMMFSFSLKYNSVNAPNRTKADNIAELKDNTVHAMISGVQKGEMTVNELLSSGKLEIYNENKKKLFVIKSYYMSIPKIEASAITSQNPDGVVAFVDYASASENFSKEMIDLIKSLKSGQKISFGQIKAQIFNAPDVEQYDYASIVNLPDVEITIK